MIKIKNKPISWVFWHPYQGLWNMYLVTLVNRLFFKSAIAKFIIKQIIKLDTWIHWRIFNANRRKRRHEYSPELPINYFDLGTHSKAKEMIWTYESFLSDLPNPFNIYAFEANPASYEKAKKNAEHIPNLHFYNVAVVNQMPASGTIQLFMSENEGYGDSIYREGKGQSIEVVANQLSTIIKKEGINLKDSINIVRMNIEGAEHDVIHDLLDNDLAQYIDGFYGAWDDVLKIDIEKGIRFKKLLNEKNIIPYPFNGPDMKIPIRKQYIKKTLDRIVRA